MRDHDHAFGSGRWSHRRSLNTRSANFKEGWRNLVSSSCVKQVRMRVTYSVHSRSTPTVGRHMTTRTIDPDTRPGITTKSTRSDDGDSERDLVGQYLAQIGQTPLLNADEEVNLAKRIEAG